MLLEEKASLKEAIKKLNFQQMTEKIIKQMNKIILTKVNEYELKCDGIYHYFNGKEIKNIKVERCKDKIHV